MKARTFVDSVVIHVAAGHGGNGCVSFRREKYIPHGGPDGGDGGRGGHVILRADRDTDSLLAWYYAPHQRAKDARPGGGARMTGRNGDDLILRVPCGTVASNHETGEPLGELLEHGSELLLAQGGKGGRGNWHWRSPTHQVPTEHTDGEEGIAFSAKLELKLAADVGLVGFPNAGKSSLLSKLSAAHPKIASYPFTTLHPIMGTVHFDDFSSIRVADIPGLLEGAHAGVGLGHAFLRHVERARAIVLLVDMAGVDGRKPFADYRVLRKELKCYLPELLKRPLLCVANKMDLPEADANLKEFKRKTRIKPLEISALDGTGVDAVKTALQALCRGTAA